MSKNAQHKATHGASADAASAWGDAPTTIHPSVTAAHRAMGTLPPEPDEDAAKVVKVVKEKDAAGPIAHALKGVEKEIEKATDVKLAFALLQRHETAPVKSRLELNVKSAVVARIKKHCFDIQQGVPQVHMGANELAAEPGLKKNELSLERMEIRARSDKDIAALLAENESLRKKLAKAHK